MRSAQTPAVAVGEQAVALASLRQPGNAGRYQCLQGGCGIRQIPRPGADQNLPHVADIKQRCGLPGVLVLSDDAGELHRQLPAGEIHQSAA